MIRRALRVVLAGTMIGVLTAPVGAQVVQTPGQEAGLDDSPTGTIELVSRSPWARDVEPVGFDLRTAGDTAGTTIRVRIHPPLADADALERSLTEDVGGITRTVDFGLTDEIPLSPGGTRRIELTGEEIRSPGVHPVVIELRSPEGGVLGLVRSPVIRLGTSDDPLAAPRLSIVVDVAIDPTVGPDGRREPTPTELARLDRLAGLLDEFEILDASATPTVLAVPDTLDALALSSDPRAPAILERITAAAATDPRAVPYVPVSAGALQSAGLVDVLETTIVTGATALTDRLGDTPDPALWRDEEVTPEAAQFLVDRGVETVLTASARAAESTVEERLLVPAGPRPVPSLAESGLTALVADGATAATLTEAVDGRVDAAVVALADLILRDDGRSSNVVVRIDDVDDGSLVVALIPLLTADDAPVALVAPPTALGGRDPDEDDLADPATLPSGSGDDLQSIAGRYREVERAVANYDAFVGADSVRAAGLAIQQLTSIATGLDLDERVALLDAAERVALSGFSAISLTGQTDLNLTSRRGALPVSISNGNDYAVQVMVRIRSDRLRFPDGEEFLVTAEPDITRLDIPVEALATGSVPTFVEVLTPDGSMLLDDRQLNVRSTAISGVGLALSLGALVVLGIWWLRTWRKGRKSDETGRSRTE